MTIWLFAYLGLGLFAGFFAGLLGVGGGAVMVPVLAMLFVAQDFAPGHLMHLALGTSMATIIFTSLSSVRAHHGHQAVLWPVVRAMTPGILLGTLLMAQFVAVIPTRPLAIFFAAFMTYVAIQLILNIKPQPHQQLPGNVALLGVGAVIGGISALVAIGGGTMSVPFLTWCNVKMQQAIGTSAGLGLPIAVAGTIGYMVSGYPVMQEGTLPAGSFGFIYLPALGTSAAASMLVAPYGARMAHRLPVPTLKKAFALVIIALLTKMLYSLFFA